MAIEMPAKLAIYWASNDINGGQDYSLQFMWTTDQGRLRLIYNATDLDDGQKALLLQNTTFA